MLLKCAIIFLCCILTVAENGGQSSSSLDKENVDYIYTYLNSPGSSLSVSRVEIVTRVREKRGVHNSTTKWSHNIPYVLDPSFTAHGESVVYTLKRAIQRIMDNVCVTYNDVSDSWNRSNIHWFTDNGYQSNAYVLFKDGGRCWSGSGQGNGNGGQQTSPCYDFVTNTHEVFHTIGASHTHQTKRRDNYITINQDDISPGLLYNYLKFEEATFVDVAFDPASVLMYDNTAWTRNGLETFTPIRDDIFDAGVSRNSDAALFYELSQVFKCKELFCNVNKIDCAPGYYTLVQGVCRCVCPSELDPELNCKTFINKAVSSVRWPNTPIVLLAGGPNNTCPSAFDQQVGWLSFDGIWPTLQKPVPVPFPSHQKTIYLPICTKSTPKTASEIDWESWPAGGRYCLIKPRGVDCRGFFGEFTLSYQSLAQVYHNGSIGDTSVSDKNVTMKLCCKNEEPKLLATEMPNKDPFRLISQGSCPKFKGLREYEALVDLYTNVKNASGTVPPKYSIFSSELQIFECYYLPPVYGCNQAITLTAQSPSVTLTTPGFGVARVSNRRCFYNFTVPANAQVRITFNTYDLYDSDYLLVKSYHKWQEPHRIANDKWPAQVVSEGEYMSLEYWSSWMSTDRQGINFTADVLLADDSCYNITTKGDDYCGNTSVTETYEDCLPWSQTVDCLDFPATGLSPIWLLLSDNKCRNPGGQLIQPWCYTYKNGSNCHKRYCDVCSTKSPIDVIKNCSLLMSIIPEFCSSAVERLGCFKTCGFKQAPTTRSTCGPPKVPLNGLLESPTKLTYLEGEKVIVTCASWNNGASPKEMMCTSSGWTYLESACQGCSKGWIQHGERCFQISTNLLNVREAEIVCRRQGPNGTLFQIRDSYDQDVIQRYRQTMGRSYTTTQWISGEFRSDTGKWYFTNTDLQMTYFNWSSKYTDQTSDTNHSCIQLTADNYIGKGAWQPVSCASTDQFKYICQVDSLGEQCSDILSTPVCEQLLTSFPSFCSESRFGNIAQENCKKSCGRCKSEFWETESQNIYCRQDIDPTLMSDGISVTSGQVMNFTCSPGYLLHSGNLKRACASSGYLLGTAPICRAYPAAQIVKLNAVRKRNSALPHRTAVLFIDDNYKVPYDGQIARWYYYCNSPGMVYFLVYRLSQASFSFVGSNNMTCDTDRVRSFYVPLDEQISVRQQDVIGLYSEVANTISVTNCTHYTDKIATVLHITANSFDNLLNSSFSMQSCLVASVGYHLEPN